jgi:hypothetical protein
MKDAKYFYDAYDIPHPHKLLALQEVLFDKLNTTQKNHQIKNDNQKE